MITVTGGGGGIGGPVMGDNGHWGGGGYRWSSHG